MAARLTTIERLGLPCTGRRFRLEAAPSRPGQVLVVSLGDGQAAGTISLEAGSEPQVLLIHRLCIDEGRRGYGAGSEAARLLLRAAVASGYSTVRAWAPGARGLALYFWVRMGLRPLHGEGPDGGIWLERRTGG